MKRETIEVEKSYLCGPPHSTEQRVTATIVSNTPHFAVLNTKDKVLGKPLTELETDGVLLADNEVLVEGVLARVNTSTWPLYESFVGEEAVIRYRFVKALAE